MTINFDEVERLEQLASASGMSSGVRLAAMQFDDELGLSMGSPRGDYIQGVLRANRDLHVIFDPFWQVEIWLPIRLIDNGHVDIARWYAKRLKTCDDCGGLNHRDLRMELVSCDCADIDIVDGFDFTADECWNDSSDDEDDDRDPPPGSWGAGGGGGSDGDPASDSSDHGSDTREPQRHDELPGPHAPPHEAEDAADPLEDEYADMPDLLSETDTTGPSEGSDVPDLMSVEDSEAGDWCSDDGASSETSDDPSDEGLPPGDLDDPEDRMRLQINAIKAKQVPAGHFSALQRNTAKPKDFVRKVPKPIVVVARVNGFPVRALLDSGSLGDFMSSALADQLAVNRIVLEKPLPVQLAVQGSRTKVNYGAEVQFEYANINEKRYFDICNVDGYDLILGTPFYR